MNVLVARNRKGSFLLSLAGGSLLLGIAYFLAGSAGLVLQSSQPGVSPLWPASGVAFAVLYLFGVRYWPGIVLGMLGLAAYTGVSYGVALPAAAGSTLEAVVPVWLLNRLGVDIRFRQVSHIIRFTLLAVIVGPLFSATSGIIGMRVTGATLVLPQYQIWLLWWTGNAIGILIVGSLIITWVKNRLPPVRVAFEITGYVIVMAMICLLSFTRQNQFTALLIMYLTAPLSVITGIRCRALGVTSISITALFMFIISALWLPQASLPATIDKLYYAQLLFIAFSSLMGLFVAAAYEERQHNDRLAYEASHDGLTGLLNRKGFYQNASDAIRTAHAHHAEHCLIFIDLDDLKAINDNAGHMTGDNVIRHVADCIRRHIRSRDCAARIGGDEFVLIFFYCPLAQGKQIAQKILDEINDQTIEHDGKVMSMSASIGLSMIDRSTKDYQQALKEADIACYEAKRAGKNQIRLAAGLMTGQV